MGVVASDHRPVLLSPVIAALNVRQDGVYVDATFGRGGHSAAILARLDDNGRLLMLDKDPAAIAWARARYGDDPRCRIVHASFADLADIARREDFLHGVDGVLLDLGVSSPQLEQAERGFSFLRDGPLDMRMDNSTGDDLAQWLERAEPREIRRVLRDYGDERFAGRIAKAIVVAREAARLPRTTLALANLIEAAVPRSRREPGKHPATRSFQALRINLNDELGDLRRLLDGVCDVLASGGRLVVISFHSLEDRLVKRFMRDRSRIGDLPPGVAEPPPERRPTLRLVAKAQRPDAAEIEANPRARSATLRVAERLT